jgi:hypothetical protein
MNRRDFLSFAPLAALAANTHPSYQRSDDEASVGLSPTDLTPFELISASPLKAWTITQVSFQIVGLVGPAFGRLAVWFDSDKANSIHSLEFFAEADHTPPYLPPIWECKETGQISEAVMCGFSPGMDGKVCTNGFARIRVTYH